MNSVQADIFLVDLVKNEMRQTPCQDNKVRKSCDPELKEIQEHI